MLYSSIENKKIKDIKKLHKKKYRDEYGKFLIEGEHLVLEAYKTGYLETVILVDGTLFPFDIETIWVTPQVMKYLSELESPSTMIGICSKLKGTIDGSRILLLDDIQDPGNLGTIIRSAAAFNVDTVIVSKNTVDIYNSKVVRASQGLLFHINIMVDDIVSVINELKNKGFMIIGTKVTHGILVQEINKEDNIALVMGNEGNGISESVELLCDKFVYIKMNELCESLNVGVATSIILYELDK